MAEATDDAVSLIVAKYERLSVQKEQLRLESKVHDASGVLTIQVLPFSDLYNSNVCPTVPLDTWNVIYALTATPTFHHTLCVPRITLIVVPLVEAGSHDSPNSAVPVLLERTIVGATNSRLLYVQDKCISTVFEPLERITVPVVNAPEMTTDPHVATVVHDDVTTCDL